MRKRTFLKLLIFVAVATAISISGAVYAVTNLTNYDFGDLESGQDATSLTWGIARDYDQSTIPAIFSCGSPFLIPVGGVCPTGVAQDNLSISNFDYKFDSYPFDFNSTAQEGLASSTKTVTDYINFTTFSGLRDTRGIPGASLKLATCKSADGFYTCYQSWLRSGGGNWMGSGYNYTDKYILSVPYGENSTLDKGLAQEIANRVSSLYHLGYYSGTVTLGPTDYLFDYAWTSPTVNNYVELQCTEIPICINGNTRAIRSANCTSITNEQACDNVCINGTCDPSPLPAENLTKKPPFEPSSLLLGPTINNPSGVLECAPFHRVDLQSSVEKYPSSLWPDLLPMPDDINNQRAQSEQSYQYWTHGYSPEPFKLDITIPSGAKNLYFYTDFDSNNSNQVHVFSGADFRFSSHNVSGGGLPTYYGSYNPYSYYGGYTGQSWGSWVSTLGSYNSNSSVATLNLRPTTFNSPWEEDWTDSNGNPVEYTGDYYDRRFRDRDGNTGYDYRDAGTIAREDSYVLTAQVQYEDASGVPMYSLPTYYHYTLPEYYSCYPPADVQEVTIVKGPAACGTTTNSISWTASPADQYVDKYSISIRNISNENGYGLGTFPFGPGDYYNNNIPASQTSFDYEYVYPNNGDIYRVEVAAHNSAGWGFPYAVWTNFTNPSDCNQCTLPDGSTMPNGSSTRLYDSQYGPPCSSIDLTCNLGVLSTTTTTYIYPSCYIDNSCIGPDGSYMADGEIRPYYSSSTPPCNSVSLVCNAGVVTEIETGTTTDQYPYGVCAAECLAPDGTTLTSGSGNVYYESAQSGGNCNDFIYYYCNDGTANYFNYVSYTWFPVSDPLSLPYRSLTCVPEAGCVDPVGTEGEVRTFYATGDPNCGSTTKTCTNGVWQGDSLYTASTCTPPVACTTAGTTETQSDLITSFTSSPQLIKKEGQCTLRSTATGVEGCFLAGKNIHPGDAFPDRIDLTVYPETEENPAYVDSTDMTGALSSTNKYTLTCCDAGGIEKKVDYCKVQPVTKER